MVVMNDLKNLLADPSNKDLPKEVKRIVAKDYLITYILSYIYGHKDYRKLVFYGGTCLRVVYGLNRLSEDIDTDNSAKINLDNFGNDLQNFMKGLLGGEVVVHTQTGEGGISRFVIKMPVLYELGLSPLKGEKLHIKVEVSSHNQIYNKEMTTLLRNGQSMTIAHFDKPSLMAGKMIACMERVFRKGKTAEMVKGRDWYDLWWYLSQGVVPNEEKLLADSEDKVGAKQAWKIIGDRLKKLKRRDLEPDLLPFFTDQIFINDWLDNFQEFYGKLAAVKEG
jgi:predicted nucleotidyltransferase component of viral defense system